VKLLSDGAHEMCNLLHKHFPAEVFGEVEQGIDFWHAIEKLAPAAKEDGVRSLRHEPTLREP
jgi:hypothetical protein